MCSSRTTSVKSRLLPLTPAEQVLERWVEMLPRREMPSPLVARHQVEVVDALAGRYHSTGTTPWFDVEIDLEACRGQWLYIEAAMVRNNGSLIAWLHFDLAGAAGSTASWPITTNLRGSVREVVCVPSQIIRMRWQPTCDAGFFSQSGLLVHRISHLESILRRWYRVALWRKNDASHRSAVSRSFRLFVDTLRLARAYRDTANLRQRSASGNDYPAFIARTERLDRGEMRRLARELARRHTRSRIAVVTHLASPHLPHFRAMVESVKTQWYPHWELWILGDPGQDAGMQAFLQGLLHSDGRVRLRTDAVSPSLIDGSAWVCESTGADYVMLVGQHDVLRSWALLSIVQEAFSEPLVDVVYSDYDQMDQSGCRFSPMFTPEWNPDLLLSHNYAKGIVAVRRERIVAVGGYRVGFAGAEDFDLLLRLVRVHARFNVRRVARVLISRRASERSSTADDDAAQVNDDTTTCVAEMRAIREHVEGHGGTVSCLATRLCYRVKYPLPSPAPLVTAIVPTRDRAELLRACLDGLLHRTDYPHLEVLVMDNGSVEAETRHCFDEFRADPRVRIIEYGGPFNYSAINNHAASIARGEILALVNNDVEVIHSDWLIEMVSHAIRPGIGAVGAKLLYSTGSVQHAGVILGIGGVAGHSHRFLAGDRPGYGCRAISIQNISAVTGACLVVRRSVFMQVSGFNEVDLAVAMNDVDFCLRLMEVGYRNLFTPFATLYHHESMSRGRDDTESKQALFRRESDYMKRRWGNLLACDPAYNPNLTLLREDFSF